jgi:DNA-binding MarR family transcriptional regulator
VYASNKPGTVLCACTTVKKLSRILGRVYDTALAESGINITQLAVLRCIDRRPGEPLARVAEELEMDRTSLYRAISPMIRDGWIVVSDGPDNRSRTAKVTRKGTNLLARAGADWDSVQDAIVQKFGKSNYQGLIDQLYRLAECAEALDA